MGAPGTPIYGGPEPHLKKFGPPLEIQQRSLESGGLKFFSQPAVNEKP